MSKKTVSGCQSMTIIWYRFMWVCVTDVINQVMINDEDGSAEIVARLVG